MTTSFDFREYFGFQRDFPAELHVELQEKIEAMTQEQINDLFITSFEKTETNGFFKYGYFVPALVLQQRGNDLTESSIQTARKTSQEDPNSAIAIIFSLFEDELSQEELNKILIDAANNCRVDIMIALLDLLPDAKRALLLQENIDTALSIANENLQYDMIKHICQSKRPPSLKTLISIKKSNEDDCKAVKFRRRRNNDDPKTSKFRFIYTYQITEDYQESEACSLDNAIAFRLTSTIQQQIQVSLGEVDEYTSNSQYELALKRLQEMIEAGVRSGPVYRKLAEYYRCENNTDEMVVAYQNAAIEHDDIEAYLELLRLYLSGNISEAVYEGSKYNTNIAREILNKDYPLTKDILSGTSNELKLLQLIFINAHECIKSGFLASLSDAEKCLLLPRNPVDNHQTVNQKAIAPVLTENKSISLTEEKIDLIDTHQNDLEPIELEKDSISLEPIFEENNNSINNNEILLTEEKIDFKLQNDNLPGKSENKKNPFSFWTSHKKDKKEEMPEKILDDEIIRKIEEKTQLYINWIEHYATGFRFQHFGLGKIGKKRAEALLSVIQNNRNDSQAIYKAIKEVYEKSGDKKHSCRRYLFDAINHQQAQETVDTLNDSEFRKLRKHFKL